MRILELGKFYPPERGGMETLLQLWTEGFAARGHDVTCVVANRGAKTVRETHGRLRIERLARFGEAFSVSFCPAYPGATRRHPAEIIHAHFPNPLADLAILRAPRETPVVVHWHSDIVRQKALMRLYQPLQSAMLRRATRIVVATPMHLEYSAWLAPHASKVVVIPFGLDLARFAATPALEARAATLRAQSRGKTVFLNVGRLVGYKGQRHAIEALPRVPEAELWIAGTGPLEDELRRLAADLGVGDRVRFLGNVPDSDLPALLHACDVFLFPSITPNEAFGLVFVEAMACSKPLIACRLKSGVPYVCRSDVNGLLVSPGSSDELEVAMRTLIASPDLRSSLGQAGLKRSREEFSLERMLDRHLELFGSLANPVANVG
ncbi:MAG: glycosyltransferase [Verrucomicrobia bacterium]|nr:MAG: glycosyltransferase [Verrucomicrobiota bacterium]